jgi:hypothetical protein
MASTFSQTLRLELIGDGDQSGIWGQTTNTNLGSLLEQAITGVESITMVNANYTLTSFNGVVDEARNAVLVVGGTNGAVRDIIAPLVEKLYVIRNNTVGGFAINIRGATGSSVSVPNGATVWVYCDGTNFNAIGTESVGNFEVNGNLTVTGNTNAVAATYTGNVVALNYSTAGNVSATGNVTATGNATAANFIGAGLTLTSINASNISAGTIANARTTASASNGASTIVTRDANGSFAANVGTFVTVSGAHSGNGAGLSDINASNISTGTISNARTTAASANGASTIVARDASGNFTANAITTTSISGNGVALTALNASNIASGTIANARTTASDTNSASSIVARDANGSFSSNVITATLFSGSGASISAINASNISSGTIANARTTAASANGASTIVTRDANGSFSANVVTATSGSFTSITGDGSGLTNLNASNVASGTLAVARGGTGVGTSTGTGSVVLSASPALSGTPTAPTAAVGTNTTQLATTAFVQAAIPSGIITMWSGSTASVPSGWFLCDGNNGTPDLRDRFVVGAGSSYAVAATGGSKDAIVVSHTHSATSSVSDPGHLHSIASWGSTGFNPGGSITASTQVQNASMNTNSATTGIGVSTSISSTGSSGTNANLPPYYALAYIMKA